MRVVRRLAEFAIAEFRLAVAPMPRVTFVAGVRVAVEHGVSSATWNGGALPPADVCTDPWHCADNIVDGSASSAAHFHLAPGVRTARAALLPCQHALRQLGVHVRFHRALPVCVCVCVCVCVSS